MAKPVNPWLAALVVILAGPVVAHAPSAARGKELTFKIATPLKPQKSRPKNALADIAEAAIKKS